jgi:arylformamidase
VLRAALLLPLLAFARTPLERLEERHLEAVHDQRIEWMKRRLVLEPLGVYQDHRAVFLSGAAARPALAKAAKQAQVDIVFSTAEQGEEDGVLFVTPPTEGFESVDLAHWTVPDDGKWQRAARKQKQYPEELYGSGTEVPDLLAQWDQKTADRSVTAFATASPAEDAIVSRSVSLRNTTTHILSHERKADDVLESLRQGHAYVAHDWLCDPTGFRFIADNNFGVFEMGDSVGTGLLAGQTRITATVPVPAQLKLIRNGQTILEVTDSKLEYVVKESGTYRLEAWLTADGESRPWIFSNPLYFRESWSVRLPPADVPPGVELIRDISYVDGSTDPKQKLDLYIPREKKNVPVVVFFHGGSWTTGDRALYTALGNRLAEEGVAVAIPSYRLMPRNPHPAQIEDAAAAFAWVHRNIASHSGDPDRMYVFGHSSGGHLAALLALNDSYLEKYGLSAAAIKGVISLSGVYDVRYITSFVDTDDKQDASPIFHVHRNAPKFFISYCQWDYLALPKQARDFSAALRKSFVETRMLYAPHDNHITEIIHVATGEGPLLPTILEFLQ